MRRHPDAREDLLIKKQLGEVWDALRASQRHPDDALSVVRIRKLRGIEDLRVPFQYPVSVLAGPNGCGKSTVLFACACAYRVPGRGPREFTPTSLFPNFTNQQPGDLYGSSAPDGTGIPLRVPRGSPLHGVAAAAILEPKLHGSQGRHAA